MKFVDGLMIHSGNPAEEYVDTAVRHVLLRQVLSQSRQMLTAFLFYAALDHFITKPRLFLLI